MKSTFRQNRVQITNSKPYTDLVTHQDHLWGITRTLHNHKKLHTQHPLPVREKNAAVPSTLWLLTTRFPRPTAQGTSTLPAAFGIAASLQTLPTIVISHAMTPEPMNRV